MSDRTKVAVVGATGYAGYELARLLLRHPQIDTPTFFLRDAHANIHCPHESLSSASRVGRSSLQGALRRGGCEKRRGCRVPLDTARSFAQSRAGAPRSESWIANCRFKRRLPVSQAGDFCKMKASCALPERRYALLQAWSMDRRSCCQVIFPRPSSSPTRGAIPRR